MTFCNRPGLGLIVIRALRTWAVRSLLICCSMLGLGWSQQAAASISCGLTPTTALSQTGAPGSTLNFGFIITDSSGGCSGTISGDIIVTSDTTGGAVIAPTTWSGFATNIINFSVTMGASNGGTVSIDARMLVGQAGTGTATLTYAASTTNFVAYTPATATTLGTNQLAGVQIGTNVLRNGVPATYPTRFDNVTAGTIIGTVAPDGSGNAFTNFSSFTASTYSLAGSIVCPLRFFDAACAAAASPINFSVTVEPTGMTRVTAATVNTAPAVPITLTAHYGSSNFPAANGSSIGWTILSQPAGGDGLVNGNPSTTSLTTSGNSGVSFAATVPGAYVVSANSGCTFCSLPAAVSFTVNVVAPVVRTLTVSSGNNQSAPTSTTLPLPLVALAQNNGGNASGVTVNWLVTAGSASLAAASSVTDINGLASVNVTMGATPGTVTITGTRADDGTAVATFTATATLVRTLTVSSGNNQSAPTSTTLPLPLVALAQNNGGNASGVTVNWLVTAGSASLAAASSVTDINGLASVNVTMGATPGTVTITGTRADDGTAVATFTATATLVRTLTVSSGNNQTGAPSSALALPFVVLAKNNGVGAPGVGITWTVTTGSGTLAPPSSSTNVSGSASSSLTLGATPGSTTVTARRLDDPGISVTFTANAALLSALPALDPAQLAVAKAIDQFCPKLPASSGDPNVSDLRQRCLEMIGSIGTDPAGVAAALDELFADVALVQSESGLLAAQAQFDNIKARIAALRSGTRGTNFGGLAINTGTGQLPIGAMFQNLLDGDAGDAKEAGTDFSRWGFFAAGTLGRGNADPGSVSPGYDFDINGLTVGADYRQSDTLIFGGSLGYTKQNNELVGGKAKLDASGWSASAYGTFYRSNSWYSDAVLTYGRNTYLTERRVRYSFALPGGGTTSINQFGKADSSGDSLTLAASFGRDFNKNGWGFGPYFRAMYTRLNFDPLTERFVSGTAGSGLALVIDTRDVTSLSSTLGGKLTYAHSASWGVLIPHLQVEWQHEFKTDPSAVEARFLYDPTATPFTITGDAVDSDFFRFGIGMSFVMTHGRSGFFYYEKLLSRERFSQDSLAFGLRLEF